LFEHDGEEEVTTKRWGAILGNMPKKVGKHPLPIPSWFSWLILTFRYYKHNPVFFPLLFFILCYNV